MSTNEIKQDEIIRMAREAGFDLATNDSIIPFLERFAALVAEHLIETNKALAKEIIKLKKQLKQKPVAKVVLNRANQITMQKQNGDYFDISKHVGQSFYTAPVSIEAAILAEREACAKVVEAAQPFGRIAETAAAIRARGEK